MARPWLSVGTTREFGASTEDARRAGPVYFKSAARAADDDVKDDDDDDDVNDDDDDANDDDVDDGDDASDDASRLRSEDSGAGSRLLRSVVRFSSHQSSLKSSPVLTSHHQWLIRMHTASVTNVEPYFVE